MMPAMPMMLLPLLGKPSGSWEDACVCVFLVLFGGLMSGLTLGLMSLDLVELEVLQRSGSPREQKQAVAVLPVVKKQHQLLVTLVLCNAIAMEALPVFLDNMVGTLVAVILSVTFVLAFGEIIPQAICSRNGLAIGANLGWLVRVLMLICFPIAYPVGKLLDLLLGHNNAGIFRRPQLKAFVSIHGKEEGKGGELSHDETTIINGALDLTLKTVEEAMTPIESTFSVDAYSKLDWEALERILATGYSRIPVYSGDPKNLIGLLLVKSLITVRAEDETPVEALSIRKLPRVPADTPLYDILNEFQKGHSHMAAVVRISAGMKCVPTAGHHNNIAASSDLPKLDDGDSTPALSENPKSDVTHTRTATEAGAGMKYCEWKINVNNGGSQMPCKLDKKETGSEARKHTITKFFSDVSEEGEVIGIITLEDVFEELIQEEIVDETDEYIDVHKRIRVSVAAPASFFFPQRVGISTNERHPLGVLGSPKTAGRIPSKPESTSILKTTYGLKQPLLDKTQDANAATCTPGRKRKENGIAR